MATTRKKPGQTACKVCKTPFRIREAGHRLAKGGGGDAARILANEGKPAKKGRVKRGCLGSPASVPGLTKRQKENLPKAMQEGILAYRKRMAKRKKKS